MTTQMDALYIYGPTGRIAKKVNDITEFYHTDHLGSTRLTTSEIGAPVTEVQYKPFGEQINTTEDDEDGLIQIVEGDFEGDGSLEVLKNIRPDQNTGLDIYLLFFFSLIELPSLLIKCSLPITSHEQIQQNNPH